MNSVAKAIAVIFHPIFMPLISAWLIVSQFSYFTFAIPDDLKSLLYSILFIMIVFQILCLGIMRKHNIISDLQINDKSERGAPIIVVLLFYVFTFGLFKYRQSEFSFPQEIYNMILGVIVSLVAAYVISKWYKISIHMIAVCGTLGVIVAISMKQNATHSIDPLFWVYVMALICGLVGSSRMFTGNHTFPEIVSGSIVGFLINYLIVI